MVENRADLMEVSFKQWFRDWKDYPYYKYPFSVISFVILQIFFGLPYVVYYKLKKLKTRSNNMENIILQVDKGRIIRLPNWLKSIDVGDFVLVRKEKKPKD